HTWFDRDLSVAGRVMVKNANGGYTSRLVAIDEPIMRIPSLAIHFDRSLSDGIKFNKETHLTPILATVSKALNGTKDDENTKDSEAKKPAPHHPILLERLAKELNVSASDIFDFELCLYDTQKAAIGGICDEFIYAARLDNLNSSYCAIEGLINSLAGDKHNDDPHIRMVALFDNEEVGSTSAYGANSALIESALRRVHESFESCGKSCFETSIANSYLISSDVTHAVHPNYSDKHEENHRPELQKGPAIKVNANQRYATTAVTSTILKDIAARHDIPLQEFVVRNDSPCGSTIGPMLSAQLGLRTVDIGNPLLSMHSIREVCGTDDV
ncbi:hypothetical protein EV175_006717, partial [Coemansia sp. RSA 1933]